MIWTAARISLVITAALESGASGMHACLMQGRVHERHAQRVYFFSWQHRSLSPLSPSLPLR